MESKPWGSGGKHKFSNGQVPVLGRQLAMFGSNKISRHRTENLEGRADVEQYWLELDDIQKLIRKLDEEDVG